MAEMGQRELGNQVKKAKKSKWLRRKLMDVVFSFSKGTHNKETLRYLATKTGIVELFQVHIGEFRLWEVVVALELFGSAVENTREKDRVIGKIFTKKLLKLCYVKLGKLNDDDRTDYHYARSCVRLFQMCQGKTYLGKVLKLIPGLYERLAKACFHYAKIQLSTGKGITWEGIYDELFILLFNTMVSSDNAELIMNPLFQPIYDLPDEFFHYALQCLCKLHKSEELLNSCKRDCYIGAFLYFISRYELCMDDLFCDPNEAAQRILFQKNNGKIRLIQILSDSDFAATLTLRDFKVGESRSIAVCYMLKLMGLYLQKSVGLKKIFSKTIFRGMLALVCQGNDLREHIIGMSALGNYFTLRKTLSVMKKEKWITKQHLEKYIKVYANDESRLNFFQKFLIRFTFEENTVEKKCRVCGIEKDDLKWCSKCRYVRYCSRECQTKDWKEHKLVCEDSCGDSPVGVIQQHSDNHYFKHYLDSDSIFQKIYDAGHSPNTCVCVFNISSVQDTLKTLRVMSIEEFENVEKKKFPLNVTVDRLERILQGREKTEDTQVPEQYRHLFETLTCYGVDDFCGVHYQVNHISNWSQFVKK